jgi:hypothetical protein
MLNLIWQKGKAKNPDDVWVDSRYFFSQNKKESWFKDSFVRKVIKAVDGAEVIDGCVLRSKEGNVMPPEYLSTGSKTAICVYEFPNLIFNATQMGDNALMWVLRLSMERDFTLLTYRTISAPMLKEVGFLKDYKEVVIPEGYDLWDLQDDWREEIYND